MSLTLYNTLSKRKTNLYPHQSGTGDPVLLRGDGL